MHARILLTALVVALAAFAEFAAPVFAAPSPVVTFPGAGYSRGAVLFNGTSSMVTVRHQAHLRLSRAMTLEAWVSPSSTLPGQRDIVVKTRSGGAFPYGLVLANGVPQAYGTIGGRLLKVTASSALPAKTWSLVGAAYDGRSLLLSVDGVTVGSKSATGDLSSSTGPLQIGGDRVWGRHFGGIISFVRIYDKALSISGSRRHPSRPVDDTQPSIAGTAAPGNTLTANPGWWRGASGGYSYQWRGCNRSGGSCSDIRGATATRYTVAAADAGSTLEIMVTATNATGSTSASSAPTALVPGPPTPAPSVMTLPAIAGTPAQGAKLTAGNGSWTGSPTGYAYQWSHCNSTGGGCTDISGATSGSYTVAPENVGHTIKVMVTATNDGGSASATSDPTAPVPAPPPPASNTSLPAITGTAAPGAKLTTSTGSWTGSPTSYAYQWSDCAVIGGSCTSISGATSSSYTVASSDVGNTVEVTVTAINAGGSTPAASAPTAPVLPLPLVPTNTIVPSITGPTVQGNTLTSTTGTWTGSPIFYSYQWQDCTSAGASCVDIAGATSSSYLLQASDVGHKILVVVTASNASGIAVAWPDPSTVVTASTPGAPANTGLPSITGTPAQGNTLTADRGTWSGSPTSYSYQWSDCTSGASCTNIGGATTSTYTVAASDVGYALEVTATATNAGGSTSASSAPTGVVPNPPPGAPTNTSLPAITGTAAPGNTLTANNGSWSGSPTSYAVQWSDCNSTGSGCANIGGATSSSYMVASSDNGHTIEATVTATNGGGSASATSAPTAVVGATSAGANFWVRTSGGTCARQNTPGSEIVSQDCGSLNAAYQKASCGDVIYIDAGSYPAQNIQDPSGYAGGSSQDSCTSNPIVFQAAPGLSRSQVTFMEVDAGLYSDAATNGGSNWTLQGVTVSQAIAVFPPAANVVINNDQTGGYYIDGVQGMTVQNSTIGPCYSAYAQNPVAGRCGNNIKINSGWQQYVNGSYGPPINTNNVTFKHNTITGFENNATGPQWAHFECFFLGGGSNILIDSNKIIGCQNYGIFIQNQSTESGSATNQFGQVTIQNNWFSQIWNNSEVGTSIAACNAGSSSCNPNYAIDFGDNNASEVEGNIMIRYNSFAPNTGVNSDGTNFPPGPNDYVIGNIGGNNFYPSNSPAGCIAGVTYAYNIFTAHACGTGDTVQSTLPYLSSTLGAENFDLASGSLAQGFVTPNSILYQLNKDMYGTARPAAGPRSAGAQQ